MLFRLRGKIFPRAGEKALPSGLDFAKTDSPCRPADGLSARSPRAFIMLIMEEKIRK